MTISLNDLGESDTESVSDLISPKASPMNRIPSAPTHAPKQFNFTNIDQKIDEETDSESDYQSDEEIDIGDMTEALLRDIIWEEMDFCLEVVEEQAVGLQQHLLTPPSLGKSSGPGEKGSFESEWNTSMDKSGLDFGIDIELFLP
jgi:hypothetical protein